MEYDPSSNNTKFMSTTRLPRHETTRSSFIYNIFSSEEMDALATFGGNIFSFEKTGASESFVNIQ